MAQRHTHPEPDRYDVFLVSLGEKGKGAYSAEGILTADCIEAGNPEYEDENCDFDDAIFLSDVNKNEILTPDGDYLDYGTRAYIEGTLEYYDDVTKAVKNPAVDNWNENINSPNFVTTIKNRIGIGQGAVNPQHGLDVDGDILIENELITANICTGTGECFRPVEVYGAEDDMNCDENNLPGVEPVIAIGTTSDDAQVFCGSTANGSGGDSVIDQFSDSDGTNRWGTFEFDGITFDNAITPGDTTDCSTAAQNLTSIIGTGTGNITCVTPI